MGFGVWDLGLPAAGNAAVAVICSCGRRSVFRGREKKREKERERGREKREREREWERGEREREGGGARKRGQGRWQLLDWERKPRRSGGVSPPVNQNLVCNVQDR